MKVGVGLVLLGVSLLARCGGAHIGSAGQQRGVPNIIWLDDCASDFDCSMSSTVIAGLATAGKIRLLAEVADSANQYSAPVMRSIATYYGLATITIGAFQGSLRCDNGCNDSKWAASVVAKFDPVPGDTRANYPACLPVLRRTLATAADHSVVLVETGYATCLMQLLNSPSDAISALSGTQLIQHKVEFLSLMAGKYPHGYEANIQSNPSDYAALFASWTTQRGFPAMYVISFEDGFKNIVGLPAKPTSPAYLATSISGYPSSPSWDESAILYASGIMSRSFIDNGDGTISVGSATGYNTWSSVPHSGHHSLSVTSSSTFVSQLDQLLNH